MRDARSSKSCTSAKIVLVLSARSRPSRAMSKLCLVRPAPVHISSSYHPVNITDAGRTRKTLRFVEGSQRAKLVDRHHAVIDLA